METSTTVPAYFAERLTQLNISPDDAGACGLSYDDAGNILQQVRTFTGRPVLWQDRRGACGRHIARINARKSFNEGSAIEKYDRPLHITRLAPQNISPGTPKYRYPSKETTGHGIKPMPTPKAIQAFNAGTIGGTGVGVEGYFKALALGTLADIEGVAFSGISVYRICADVAEYIQARQFDRFIILYDADARELRVKAQGNVSAARVLAFRDSAARFAAQFFELIEREHLNTKLFFAAVSSDAAHKGIDDLLAGVDGITRANIATELRDAVPDARYFDIFELKKTTHKKALNDYFGTRTHETFYRKYGHLIGDRPFTFGKGTYAMRADVSPYGIFGAPSARLELLNNPFAVDIPAVHVAVEKYMDEARAAIDEAIDTSPRVCIQAPTGTGKTSYFLGHREKGRRVPGYFERTGTRGVLCVPYVALAKQLAAQYGIPALYGRISIRDREEAQNAPAYIVTYDNLRHCDLYGRVLVVDEAHNLVSQYGDIAGRKPFRAAVLRAVVERFADAEKTILISGTPPRLMAKHFDFSFIEVKRRISNLIALRTVETETAGADALIAAVLGEMLPGVKENPGQVHCVFWNSRRRLAILRDALIGAGIAADDIALLTRADVLNGHPVYNGIVNNESINGVRVLLSTCLISEGVNIKNENIGGVFCVDVGDPAAFIQYTARFRKIERLNVVSIRKPERALDDMFFLDAADELALELERADIQRRIVEYSRIAHGDELGDEFAPFADELAPSYRWAPDILREVYFDGDGRPRVDELFILARIRERQIKYGNNCAFYSELCRAGNIHIAAASAANEEHAEPNTDAVQLANIAAASAADKKAAAMAHLGAQLKADAGIVVSAYHARVKRAGNRHASARIEALAPDLLNHPGAAMYEAQHGEHFAEKHFTDAINQFCRARFMGEDALDVIKESPGKFAERWRRYKRAVEFALYDNRRTRAMLRPHHKAEIRFFLRTQQAITEWATDGKITLADAVKILKERTRAMSAATFTQMSIVPITPAEAERIVKMLFEVETACTATGKVFFIRPAARLELGAFEKYFFIF